MNHIVKAAICSAQDKRLSSLILCAALASFASNAHATPINVGVVYGGGASGVQLVSQLNNDTYFDFNAVGLSAGAADTAGELAAYDVLILGDSGFNDNGYTDAMFAAIKQFMNGGKGVVTVGWYNFATDFMSGQKALDADYVTPIADGSYHFQSTPGTLDVLASHPITAGIADFAFSGNHMEFALGVDSGAVKLGSVIGTPSAVTIAYQDVFGRSVYLGGLYLANQSSYNTSGLRTGVEDQLLEQAVAWGAQGSAQTPDGGATLLLLGLTASGLATFRKLTNRRASQIG